MTKRKATFRTAEIEFDGSVHAKERTAWKIIDASLPKNQEGWFAYRQVFAKGYQRWWLIEGRTGLSVQSANTLRTAIDAFLRDEVKLMTWCGLAANKPEVGTLPLWKDTDTEAEQQWES